MSNDVGENTIEPNSIVIGANAIDIDANAIGTFSNTVIAARTIGVNGIVLNNISAPIKSAILSVPLVVTPRFSHLIVSIICFCKQ